MAQTATATRLLTYNDLRTAKGIAYERNHLRAKCEAGEFPAPVILSPRRIAWREADVDAWIANLTTKPLIAKRSNRKAAA
jgi:predicted DNA-binding transcriptional regulator AlpA